MSVSPEPGAGRRYGFSTYRRLRRAAQFKKVFEGGCRAADSNFTVLARPNGRAGPRLGLAISAKAAGNAVSRNKIKRTVRETFRIIQTELTGIDVVVMARRGVITRTGAEMRASLQRLFRSIDKKCARS